MTEQEKTNETPETAVPETETPTEPPKDAKPSVRKLTEQIAKLEAEAKEKDDKYLRMAAEYDNFRRRSREEKDGVYAKALADAVTALLPIIDNLERATLYEDAEKVKEGLGLTLKTVTAALDSLNVTAFGAPGDKFDPAIHNAVMHVEDEALGEGEVVEVFQKGYKKGDKVIRFAMVKTAN